MGLNMKAESHLCEVLNNSKYFDKYTLILKTHIYRYDYPFSMVSIYIHFRFHI